MYWRPYESVAKKKEKAKKKLAKLRKKNPNMQPVTVEGRKLTSTWWGKAWNENLQDYADYDNRMSRGRSYLRHGAILDLKITAGKIKALVQGTQSSPYSITIKIESLSSKKWQKLQTACQGELKSLQAFLDGEFPKELGEILTSYKSGLFPSTSEITFSCSCPDWAEMCKHVTAALYGVGTRLDSKPELFFVLRGVDVNDLISKAVEDKKLSFLEKAKQKSSRVIADSDLSALFGIEMQEIKKTIGQNSKTKKSKKAGKVTKKNDNKTTKLKSPTNLKESQQRVFDLLSKQGSCLASDKAFAKKAKIGATYLRVVLEELATMGYVTKQKQGRKTQYKAAK